MKNWRVKPTYRKKKNVYTGKNCPLCGKPLVTRINSNTREPFIGCSGYPICRFIERSTKDRIDYVIDSFPNKWKPNLSKDVRRLLEKCASRPEIKYLLGAAYYLDFLGGSSDKPLGLELYGDMVLYNGVYFGAINFIDPFRYWDCIAPSAMSFVPQLRFAQKLHHDFGIFFSDSRLPSPSDWWFGLAIEIDYHPEHEFNPGKDKFRDSLVNYSVIRLKPEIDEPLTWFKKVVAFWDIKYENH